MAIILTQDWEGTDAEIAADWNVHGAGWPTAPFNPHTTSVRSFSGTRSLVREFQGHQSAHIPGCPCTTFPLYEAGSTGGRYFTSIDEMWLTWFEWVDVGFQYDCIGTKGWYIYAQDFTNQNLVFVYYFGAGILRLDFQIIQQAGSAVFTQNIDASATPKGKWIGFEAHIKLNTPGVSDGVYELFRTNMTDSGPTIQLSNFTGIEFRGPTPTSTVPSTYQFSRIKAYTQDGNAGNMYWDKVTVSTTRVGVGSVTPPDTTPPTAPTGVTATTFSSSQINLNWTLGTDNVGVTSTLIERCGGVGCANFAQVTGVGAPGVNFSDTGLPASSTFQYRLRSTDAAGNLSPYSPTVSATTQAAGALAHINTIATDPNGANITMLGATYAIRYFTDTIATTIISGLGGTLTYRHNILWPGGTTFVCYAAQDVNGVWENDVDPLSYKCASVTTADTTPPAAPTGVFVN